MRLPGIRIAALCAGLFLLTATSALSAPSPVHLEYSVPEGCPAADVFSDQLSSRLPADVRTSPATHARPLVVRVVRRGGLYFGSLSVREANGSTTERRVTGRACGDVVVGLALIAAVALDPRASTDSAASAPATAAQRPSAGDPDGAPPAAREGSVDATKEATAEAPDREPAIPDAQRPPSSSAPPPRAESQTRERAGRPWSVALGLNGEALSGAAPSVLFAAPLFVDIGNTDSELFAPSMRARFEWTGSGLVTQGAASGRFYWTAGSLDVCPIAWTSGPLRATPCLRGEGGALSASGANVQPARSEVRPWFSVGLLARIRWAVFRAAFLEAEANAFAPIVRDRFFIEPSATLFRSPPVGWSAALGAGVPIW